MPSIESIDSTGKMRIRSSCSDRKNFECPGSPWRPERPRSWLSMRRLSCRSVPITIRPPAASAFSLSRAICSLMRPILMSRSTPSRPGGFLLDTHLEIAAELDVGAAARHVGGDRHRARHARIGDDLGFLLVVAGVQHLHVADALCLEQLGEHFRLLDRGRADQHRLAALLAVDDDVGDLVELLVRRAEDRVVVVLAHDVDVGRHGDDVEAVDVGELFGFRRRRTGHAGELLVEAEIVLEGDRGQRLVLGLDLDALLGLQRLVQAFGIAAARHHAAGELVDDHHFVVADDVVLVLAEHLVGAQRRIGVVHEVDVLDVVEALALHQLGVAEQPLELFGAALGEGDRALLLVVVEIALADAAS